MGLAIVVAVGSIRWPLTETPPPPPPSALQLPQYGGGLRYLALGDSYTIGQGVAPAERWPALLAVRLRARGLDLSDPFLLARTGWTTEVLLRTAERELVGPEMHNFSLVTVLIGVNDQYTGLPVSEFQVGLERLLDFAQACAGGKRHRLVVISIPDWSVTAVGAAAAQPARIAQEIDAYNSALRAVCRARDLPVVDVTALSRDSNATLAEDGLHPGPAQYRAWVELLLPTCAKALQH